MNRLTYSLAVLLLGVAASTTATASPQDARALTAGQGFGRDSFDSSLSTISSIPSISSLGSSGASSRAVKVAYTPVQAESSANLLVNTSYAAGATSNKRDSASSEESPQNKALTLLACVAVIFVIAKRRLSAHKF